EGEQPLHARRGGDVGPAHDDADGVHDLEPESAARLGVGRLLSRDPEAVLLAGGGYPEQLGDGEGDRGFGHGREGIRPWRRGWDYREGGGSKPGGDGFPPPLPEREDGARREAEERTGYQLPTEHLAHAGEAVRLAVGD